MRLRGLSGGGLVIWGDALAEAAARNCPIISAKNYVIVKLPTWLRFGSQSASLLFKLAEYLLQ